jgi:PAS domain S-box-containing protein
VGEHILFESAPGISLALAPDAPKFTVIAASNGFIQTSQLARQAIIGKGLFEVPTTDCFDTFLAQKESLIASFQYVIEQKKAHQLPFRQYCPATKNGTPERHLQICNVPVLDTAGAMSYIIINWENITAEVKEEQSEIRFKGITNAYDLLMQAPMVIGMVKGKDHVLQLANNEAFKLWGRGPEMIGKPLLEAIPELKGQKVIELFDGVLKTGRTYTEKALPVTSHVNGTEEQHYFDIVYQPVFEEGNNQPVGVFTMSHDVTEMVITQKKIAENEERLHVALETAHMGMWDLNIFTKTLVVSDELKKMFGLPVDKEYGYDAIVNAIIEEDREYTLQVNRDVMQLKGDQSDYDLQYRIRRANDGKLRWIRAKGKVHVNSEGQPVRFTGVMLDITPQKEAQERFFHIFESVPVCILEKDYSDLVGVLDELKRKHGDGLKGYLEQNIAEVYRLMFLIRIKDINRASLKMFEAERKSQLLKGLAAVFTEEAIPAFIGELLAVANRDKSYQAEYMLQTLKGRKIPCLTTISFPAAQYDSVLITRYDISDYKKAEQALAESEERFRTMANSIPQLAWMTDKNGGRYWFNDRWYQYTGTTPEDMFGWGWKKVHHPDMVDGVEKRFKEAVEAGRSWEDIVLLRSKKGEYRWFLSRAVPVRDESQAIMGWFGTNTDITDQRKIEHALKKSEEQLLLAIDGGELGVYDYYPITGEMAWSKQMKALFGVPADAAVGYDTFLDALHPEDRERSHRAVQASLLQENGGRYEDEYRVIADGKVKWLRAKGKAFFDKYGKAWRVAGVNMDVTRQKAAEAALKQSEQLLRSLVENLPQLIWVTDAEGITEFASQRWAKYIGKQPLRLETLQPTIHPDEWRFFFESWLEGIKTGRPLAAECRLKSRNDKYQWFAVHGEPVRDERGKIQNWIAAFTNIDDQKTFSKRLEKQVIERTKELKKSNEELQRFVHVSSHDFREPIRKMMLFTGQLENTLKGNMDEPTKFYLKTVRSSALRLMAILEGVLKYSAVNFAKIGYKKVDLNEIIKKAESELKPAIQDKKALINCTTLPKLRGNPDLLYIVFYNLISNSLKFAKAGVPPIINITSETVRQKEKTTFRILLQDNGIGFDQQFAEKIFGSFTRLESQDKYEGVGLGLSFCKKIIEQHGGSITAEGIKDVGATFKIILPLHYKS